MRNPPKKPPEAIAQEKFTELCQHRRSLADVAGIITFLQTQTSLAAKAALKDALDELPNLLGMYSVAAEDYKAACVDVHG